MEIGKLTKEERLTILETKLVDFWNYYQDFFKELSKKDYFKLRKQLFQVEMASKIHDIQGKLVMIEKELKEERRNKKADRK